MSDEVQFAWHIHHYTLIEALTEPIEKRVQYIQGNKPESEIELRLQLLRPVINTELLPVEFREASQACVEVRQAYKKAKQAYDIRSGNIEVIIDAMNRAYDKLYREERVGRDIIEELHRAECPDCPWDGHTIFSKGVSNAKV